jgi:hypothetical protein
MYLKWSHEKLNVDHADAKSFCQYLEQKAEPVLK